MSKQKTLKFLIILGFFIALLVLNQLTWYTSDDFSYHYFLQGFFPTEQTRELKGVFDLFKSQANHYQVWNGRYLPHFFIQILMQMPKTVFNILNSVAFVALGFIIKKTSSKINHNINDESKNSPFYVFIMLTILWFFIPEFGLSYLWLSGSLNYTWLSLIYAGFIFYLIKNNGNYNYIILAIFSFFAATTNENSGPATIVIACLILLLFHYKNNKKVILKQTILTIFFGILGFLSILLSPAALRRGSMEMTFVKLLENFNNIFHVAFSLFAVLYGLIAILTFALSFEKKLDDNDSKYIIILIAGHLLSIFSLILSPEQHPRSFFGGAVYLFILFLFLTIKYFENVDNTKFIKFFCSFIMIFLFARSYGYTLADINKTHATDLERFKIIEEAKEKGDFSVSIPMYENISSERNAMINTLNIIEYEHAWVNKWYAVWFDLEIVKGYKAIE